MLQLSVLPLRPGRGARVEAIRRDWQLSVKAFASREPVAAVLEREIPGPDGPVRFRAYLPSGPAAEKPLLVWFHGGGFVFGDMYTAGATCRALAARSGAVVVAVRYRLAPEHPLEAGRADCLAVVRWLAGHAAEIGGDRRRMAVGGDSAGGGIAALVAQECTRSGPQLAAQVLVYPATDMVGTYPSASEPMPGLLTGEWTAWIRERIAEVSDLSDPSSSAIRTEDLTGVAPAIVLTAGFDPLRDEGIAYAERLRAAGVPVRLLHYPGQIHGFLTFDRVLSGARDALRRLGTELASAFAGRPASGVEADLPPFRHVDRLLWLRPTQRWHELKVAALLVRERLDSATADRHDRRRSR
jgi:acetyl esterase